MVLGEADLTALQVSISMIVRIKQQLSEVTLKVYKIGK